MLSLPDLLTAAENPTIPLFAQRYLLDAIAGRKHEFRTDEDRERYQRIAAMVRERLAGVGFAKSQG